MSTSSARRVDDRSFAQKAADAWSDKGGLPDWVGELAVHADAKGLAATGAAIGYSPSLVSTVIAGKYGGNLALVAERVRGALMGATVDCPRLGEMTRNTCLDWQAKPFAPTSSLRVEMFHACRAGCPHFRAKGGRDAQDS